ncbi:hypothetical protein HII31_03537 [Pseudocercospora fuligena]|uniref:Uncharacterized protein n=1 Tax=Pseudocercospora fuligena TaxID=685502 RepID=A0A8H6RPD0_9PEZI|nr:hypothetical protein HII31_03537 [Pseudocercospora fuligena]
MAQFKYAGHLLPRKLPIEQLRKFASLAQEAARSIPSMILYRQHQLEWTEKDWTEVLADERLHWVVCTAVMEDTTTTTNTLEGRWVGLLSLRGPLSDVMARELQLQSHSVDENGAQVPCWAASRLFIKARHRGSSEAIEQLFAASRRTVAKVSVGHRIVAVFSTVAGNVEDSVLHQYYAATGCETVGHISYRGSLYLYGELDRLPEDIRANISDTESKLLLRFRWEIRDEEQSPET